MNKAYEENDIQNIANAIREKTKSEAKMKVSEMAEAISSIKTGNKRELSGFKTSVIVEKVEE